MNASVAVVYWRDIPAQVIVRAGRRTARRVLPARFQAAIDQAAMRAGSSDSDAYLGEWRRGDAPAADAGEDRRADAGGCDPEGRADALVRRLEAEFTAERLAAFVAAGGRTPAEPSGPPAAPGARRTRSGTPRKDSARSTSGPDRPGEGDSTPPRGRLPAPPSGRPRR